MLVFEVQMPKGGLYLRRIKNDLSGDVTAKLNWKLWFNILGFVLFFINCSIIVLHRQFFFDYGNSFRIVEMYIFSTFTILIYLGYSVIFCVINLVRFLLQKKKLELAPILLLMAQIIVISLALTYPTADFYKAKEKSLNELASYIENKYPERTTDLVLNAISLPDKLDKDFKLWPVDVQIKDGVIKIRVKLSGSSFGTHRFMLYRSDGQNPDNHDLSSKKSIFEHKSENWFLVDWRD